MAKRLKIPRASIAVSLTGDTEFIALLALGREGRDAALLFLELIVVAKDQGNDGHFNVPPVVLASLLRWPNWRDVVKARETLEKHTNWLEPDGSGGFHIRSFAKWNPKEPKWGGKRNGSGRPVGNQDEINLKTGSNQDDSPLQVETVTETETGGSAVAVKPSRARENPPDEYDPRYDSSAAYSVEPSDVQAVIDAIPPKRVRKKRQVENAIRKAIVIVQHEGQTVDWLVCRIAAYYASPEGTGPYFDEPQNWLHEERWSNDDLAWQGRDGQTETRKKEMTPEQRAALYGEAPA